MGSLDYLNNRTDSRVITALTRRCTICKAPPGTDCRHPWETTESLGRVVHLARAQAHLDLKSRRESHVESHRDTSETGGENELV